MSRGVDLQDVLAPRQIGRADIDQFVEPARPQQRRIDQRRAVGRTDHHDRLQFFHPVHFGEDRVDHPRGHLRLAMPPTARGDQAVDLVDEEHAGRNLPRAGEQAADLLLAFADTIWTAGRNYLIEMKFASASLATALASRVLPVPGGP